MRKLARPFANLLATLLAPLVAGTIAACTSSATASPEAGGWDARAQNVTIIRDDWGIAHVYGKTDADAVFGMIYAQAEDDFNRVETNFINAMGRLAEAEGEKEVWRDLRMKLFIDPASLKAQYAASEPWLRELMDAWADGLNFYLAKHPDVIPRVITHFEPWMALSFSEGSIGGDIESISLANLERFYAGQISRTQSEERSLALALEAEAEPSEPTGSNGFAIAPANTANGRALLLINPHTSFFFRSELQMVSEEGLNAYGASTWGQFFIYQGFNENAGWMHTSSGADRIDEYAETVTQQDQGWAYRYGDELRPVTATKVSIPYKTDMGMGSKEFTVYRTHHGPIVREADGRWIAVKLMQDPVKALTQAYMRTKARDWATFRHIMELHTNSSNNTIYADKAGNISYFHANFVPRREARFDWRQPVDGSDPRTEWQGLLAVDESPNLLNPATGWLYNSNDSPWEAAGSASRRKADFPAYVDNGGPSARGRHAVRVLQNKKDFTIESLRDAAYDSYLTAFERTVPALVESWDRAAASSLYKVKLGPQIEALRRWDLRWSETSVPTSLAVYWGDEMRRRVADAARAAGMPADDYIATRATADQRLEALATVSDKLASDFGRWDTPWGEINRFQRLTGDIVQPFDDDAPSIPVGFTSGTWGSLASFGARTYPRTKRMYGTSGNSFVAIVEFGDSVRAVAVTAGGESGNPSDAHFNDQAQRYARGELRPVYFYRSQLEGHIEREYHPGETIETIGR
jgi:acyl-homoserine-lactone acylase